MIQDMVWDISILLMGSLAAVFVGIAFGAQVPLANYGPAIASAYRVRAWLFVLALIILVGANYRALGALPYVSELAQQSSLAVKRVDATGQQWSWTVTPARFAVGQTVDFYVTSKDVNHGFGLYDPHMRIVGQTQAMPGYTNILRYTFREPGAYHVLCLEYCGLAHHEMETEIDVAAH
jgi:cytochrome c oxidase subunit II